MQALETNIHFQGLIMQTLDVLDFSVIHLSTFERGFRRNQKKLWPTYKNDAQRKVFWGNISVVKSTAEFLTESSSQEKHDWLPEAKRTVVIMPFLGGAMGAGHSVLSNRYVYLVACFWSIYKYIPNIIVSVASEADVEWAKNKSGMPFYDVFHMKGLPKSAALPVATTQETRRRILDGRLDFDYIFYTESDQILLWRDPSHLYDYLRVYPEHMLLPHRLMAYPPRVLEEIHHRTLSANHVSRYDTLKESLLAWTNMSCCLPRQNCVSRKRWVHLKNAKVPIVNYLGIEVPLGNSNFLDEIYRPCRLSSERVDICP